MFKTKPMLPWMPHKVLEHNSCKTTDKFICVNISNYSNINSYGFIPILFQIPLYFLNLDIVYALLIQEYATILLK